MASEPRLLPDVHYQQLDNGRVRCIETGHEMPEAHARDYGFTKKCKVALFDKALAARKGAFKYFEQSSTAKDKIVCNMTGVVLNKTEEALWKHMTGKKFTRALDEKEAEKTTKSCNPEPIPEAGKTDELADGKDAEAASRKPKRKTKKGKNPAPEEEVSARMDEEDCEPGNSDFWFPPVGDRWDNDDGGDRWHASPGSRRVMQRGVQDMSESEEEAGSAKQSKDDEDIEMGEGSQSPEPAMDNLSMKRTSLAVGPSSFAGKKKKKKKN